MEHAPLIRAGGRVLDLACGKGRNARWLARQGWQVEAVDCDVDALAGLQGLSGIKARQYDLESAPWPYATGEFDGIVVCRYLHRPLLPHLLDSLAPGGILIYETYMQGQERFGRPRNPYFLLKPDELRLAVADACRIVAFQQGEMHEPTPAMLQRICAIRNEC